jgi:hypothetical protein
MRTGDDPSRQPTGTPQPEAEPGPSEKQDVPQPPNDPILPGDGAGYAEVGASDRPEETEERAAEVEADTEVPD